MDVQVHAWFDVTEITQAICNGRDELTEDVLATQHYTLDVCSRRWSMAVIQHPLPKQTYDSVLISYTTALFWSPKEER
jgi:hypothetical protein